MPAVTLYRLRPRGPMHIGVRGIEVEGVAPFPSAATVFSAWCWAVRDLAGVQALEGLLSAFQRTPPPFLLAAPLPWIDQVLLLPRPWLPAGAAPETRSEAPRDKRGKRYRWVAEDLWFQLLAGDAPAGAFDDDAAFHQEWTIWAAGEAGQRLARQRQAIEAQIAREAMPEGEAAFWRVAVLPHVTVDRRTSAGQIYHRGATWFAPGTDLALPVVWRAGDPTRALLERALILLGEMGIGGERSAGYGQFDVAGHDLRQWPDLTTEEAFVTLAGYHPTPEEARAGVFAPPASYQLEISHGRVEHSTYRYGLRLVRAGSVLRHLAGRTSYGALVDVTPEPFRAHRVYRYGYAFPLPVGPNAVGNGAGA